MESFLLKMRSIPNIHYIGCIHYSNKTYKQSHPIFIYKKSFNIPIKLYNPKLIITNIIYKHKNFNIICDDLIIGGSKTRAGLPYLQNLLNENKSIKSLLYYGAPNGYAQLCLAYCMDILKQHDIELIILSRKIMSDEIKKLRTLTSFYHNKTKYIDEIDKKKLYKIFDKYKEKNDCFTIPFGFHDQKYEDLLYKQINKYYDDIKHIKRL